MMKQVILDTNFLLIPAQFNVDIFSEIERLVAESHKICIMSTTLNELEKLTEKGKGKNKKAAKLALQLIEHKNLKIIDSDNEYVDKAIIDIADSNKHIVCTQDKALKKTLQKKRVPIIVLRKKNHLEFAYTIAVLLNCQIARTADCSSDPRQFNNSTSDPFCFILYNKQENVVILTI